MTDCDTPRPPMSETVKPLTKEWLVDQRKLAERNPNGYLMIGQDVLSVLEALEKAERDLAQSREKEPKKYAGFTPMEAISNAVDKDAGIDWLRDWVNGDLEE